MHGKLFPAAGLPEISEAVDGRSPEEIVAGPDPRPLKHTGRAIVDEFDVPKFPDQQRLQIKADHKKRGNNDKSDAQTRPRGRSQVDNLAKTEKRRQHLAHIFKSAALEEKQ